MNIPKQKQLTIGLQVVSLSDSFNNAIIDCVNTVATKLNVNLILFLGGAPRNPDLIHEHHQSVIYDHINSDNVDAVILLTPTLRNYTQDFEFKQIIKKLSSVPAVSIGMDLCDYLTHQSSIIIDSEFGFSSLIEHLIVNQKMSDLAFITGPLKNTEAQMRFNTFKHTLNKHNIVFNEDKVFYGNFTPQDAAPSIDQFLKNGQLPQAIICSNDACAIAVIKELNYRGFKVPDDVAVTGFDNINESKTCTPTLSTVSQSFIKIGALAIQLAVRHALNKPCDKLYTLETAFIQRESTGTKNFKTILQQKGEFDSQLNEYIIPFEKNSQESKYHLASNLTIYGLLDDIINTVMQHTSGNIDQNIVELEEHYLPIIVEQIKFDIRIKLKHQKWLDAVVQIENENNEDSIKCQTAHIFTIMIREILAKEEALLSAGDISTRENIYFIKYIIEELSDSKNFDELAEKLRSKYQQLSHFINLENYVVLGYPDPIRKEKFEKWIAPPTIDMILSFNDIHNKNYKNEKALNSKYLFPEGLKPNKKRYTMVVETLCSLDNQLGRVSYELYPRELDLFSCAMLTTQIVSTIRIIHQNNERKIAQNKIDLLVKDLETKKQLAEEATVAKGRFLATMSHEIRTPMNGVLGITELLKDTQLDDKQNDYLDIIQISAHSLLNIISDILDFSKIEEGKLELENIAFNLEAICNEVITLFKFNASKNEISLNLDIDPSLPKAIQSDPTRLRQILINLIGNAFKFTEKGSITLKIEPCINHQFANDKNTQLLKFSIIDTGIGISKQNSENLFGAFNQADSSTTRRFGGTGLGLSISKSLAELMGGDIGIISKLNKGSTFWFTIVSRNLKLDSIKIQDSKKQCKISAQNREFNNSSILIAEDNKVNQLVIKGMIKKLGAQTTVVDNGQEALEHYQANYEQYDLIIMDFEMPILDGASATKKIRAFEQSLFELSGAVQHVPIIAITAHAMNEHRELCIEAGMDDYLSKPIDSERLYQLFCKLL